MRSQSKSTEMSIPPLMAHSSNIPFSWVPAPESVPQPELPSTLQDSRCSNCPLMLKKVSQLEKKLTCLEKERDQICKQLNQEQTKCAELRLSPSVQSVLKDNFAIEKNRQREKQQKGISVRPSAAFPKENHPLTPAEVEQLRIWFPDCIIPKEAIPLMARMTQENSTYDVIEPERNSLVKPEVREELTNPYRIAPAGKVSERKSLPIVLQAPNFHSTEGIHLGWSQTLKIETNADSKSRTNPFTDIALHFPTPDNVMEETLLEPESDYNPKVILELTEHLEEVITLNQNQEQQKPQSPNNGWSTQKSKWFRSSVEQRFFDKDQWVDTDMDLWVDMSDTGLLD